MVVPHGLLGSTLRAPADPFARDAVSSQRSLLAAQFSRSAVSVLPSKPGRAQGWAKGPIQKAQGQRAQGTKGPFGPFGPRGPSGPWAPWGRLYARNAIPNGIDDAQRKLFRMESIYGIKCTNILNKLRTRVTPIRIHEQVLESKYYYRSQFVKRR